MVFVYIKGLLKDYEADIRDLCLAFFSLEKLVFVFDDNKTINEIKEDVIKKDIKRKGLLKNTNQTNLYINDNDKDIIIDNYYDGSFEGNRFDVKGKIKRSLYDYLSNITKKKLIWGTLTGIRPVTIVTGLLERDNINGPKLDELLKENKNNYDLKEVIYDYLHKEYYISKEKGYELIDIAYKELDLLNDNNIKNYKDRYSVYIGVPFCKSTCLYCSFTSFNIDKMKDYVEKYLISLDKELSLSKEKIKEQNKNINKIIPQTLYIGGGTPTSLSEKDFEKFLNIIEKYVDKDKLVEYTIEAGRPDTITEKKLLLMKEKGVTRISINPQSFNQKTLDLIGRKHTVNDVIEKYYLARDLGFNNINMDIILGLPNEHIEDVKYTLDEIKKLNPDSLTVHSLALKRAARLNLELNDWTKDYYLAGLGKNNNGFNECEKREIDDMFTLSKEYALSMNMRPYYLYRQKNMAGNLENVGYAKERKECIYNIMMMEERHSVYSFGTGTTKKIFYEKDGKRIESVEGYKSVIDYINFINK